MWDYTDSEDVGLEAATIKKCVIAYSSSDPAPKMIGDQALYRSSGLYLTVEW